MLKKSRRNRQLLLDREIIKLLTIKKVNGAYIGPPSHPPDNCIGPSDEAQGCG